MGVQVRVSDGQDLWYNSNTICISLISSKNKTRSVRILPAYMFAVSALYQVMMQFVNGMALSSIPPTVQTVEMRMTDCWK